MATNGENSCQNPVNKDYRQFFDTFQSTVDVRDPLPLKVGSHTIREHELEGEIVDWTLQYLQQKNCPSKLLSHLVSLVLWEIKFCISKDETDKGSSRERGYEPVKLMQLVTSKINNVCLDHIDNRKFENLCTELSFNHRVLHPVSVDAVRNGRRKMEDRHVVIQDLNRICSLKDDVPMSYYAVFDGHAGTDAAFYAASQLHEKLVNNTKFPAQPDQALKEAFLETDRSFVNEHENERLKGGTTAVVCLIRDKLLLTAWLGDSQAVLVRDGIATQLVNPHKPDRPDEKERITNLGGEVIFWDGAYRVHGQLAVSRAIGDASYKPYVTAEPDILVTELDGSEDFLIIGCDGLWDTVGVDESAFLVQQYLHHESDVSGVSRRLVQTAKQKGSLDNISVITVFLRDPASIGRRPLPPAPSSADTQSAEGIFTSHTPSMEEQQEEYEKLTAKWGWNEPQGGAVFSDSPWNQPQHQAPPTSSIQDEDSNPFGAADQSLGDFECGEGANVLDATGGDDLAAKWGWKDPEIEALEREAREEGAVASSSSVASASDAQWGWSDPEVSDQFAATSIQPMPEAADDGLSQLEEKRLEFERIATKWTTDLEQFDPTIAAEAAAAVASSLDVGVVLNGQVKSDFHLSSDGSTWENQNQTDGTGPQSAQGVNWDQYDDEEEDQELSGQQSLIFVPDSTTTTGGSVISPIDDPALAELANGPSSAQHQMWASDENSVSFEPMMDASADEGIQEDETDFSSTQPDVVAATSVKSNDADFHWNLHAPQFQFGEAAAATEENEQQERKLSATELLVRSSNDAELAVLLAAANDDPDDDMMMDDPVCSPRSDDVPHNIAAAANESKGDGTVDASDSDDEWTFDNYRGKPEGGDSEAADCSSVVEVEADSFKASEVCSESNCQANDLGEQLERLTVDDSLGSSDSSSIPPAQVEMEPAAVQTVVNHVEAEPINDLVEVTQSSVVNHFEAEPIIDMVEVTQSSEISSTTFVESCKVEETLVETTSTQELVSEPVAPLEASLADTTVQETPAPVAEIIESRQPDSPVSSTAATIGSDAGSAAVPIVAAAVAATATAVAASKAKSPVAKKPTASITVAKKTAGTPAKPSSASAAKTATKEPVKKIEPASRRPAAEPKAPADASAAAKPARPTKLSPLRKAAPAAATTTAVPAARPTPAPRTTTARPASAPKPAVAPVKKTTTTAAATAPATGASRATSATAAKRTPLTSATKAPATPKPAPTPRTPLAATPTPRTPKPAVTAAKPAVKLSSTPAKPTSAAASRPAAKPTTNGAATASVNGHVKPKPATTTRTPTKPLTNGTAATSRTAAPKPSPLKSVASRTATPGKPLAPSKTAAVGSKAAPPSRTVSKTSAATKKSVPAPATQVEAVPQPPSAEEAAPSQLLIEVGESSQQ